jgi:hypothetical protein
MVNGKELLPAGKIFSKISDNIARLVYKTLLCRYPRHPYSTYNNCSEFKLDFEYLCKSYGTKRKPTVKNTQVNAILDCMHKVMGQMLCTAEINMVKSYTPNEVDVFLDNAV